MGRSTCRHASSCGNLLQQRSLTTGQRSCTASRTTTPSSSSGHSKRSRLRCPLRLADTETVVQRR